MSGEEWDLVQVRDIDRVLLSVGELTFTLYESRLIKNHPQKISFWKFLDVLSFLFLKPIMNIEITCQHYVG